MIGYILIGAAVLYIVMVLSWFVSASRSDGGSWDETNKGKRER